MISPRSIRTSGRSARCWPLVPGMFRDIDSRFLEPACGRTATFWSPSSPRKLLLINEEEHGERHTGTSSQRCGPSRRLRHRHQRGERPRGTRANARRHREGVCREGLQTNSSSLKVHSPRSCLPTSSRRHAPRPAVDRFIDWAVGEEETLIRTPSYLQDQVRPVLRAARTTATDPLRVDVRAAAVTVRPTASAASSHVPDVLETLAQLPNDEVFTPPKVASAMLDITASGCVWSNPDYRWLDPATKSGVFSSSSVQATHGRSSRRQPEPDLRKRARQRNMLYGAAITSLSADRAPVRLPDKECDGHGWLVDLTIKDWVVEFDNPEGNVRYVDTEHTISEGGVRFAHRSAGSGSAGDITPTRSTTSHITRGHGRHEV